MNKFNMISKPFCSVLKQKLNNFALSKLENGFIVQQNNAVCHVLNATRATVVENK